MTTTPDPLEAIFAYRVFDLRDRFPEPVATFREALACLQSDRAYLPELSGDIVAYVRGGYAITVPAAFYLRRQGDRKSTRLNSSHVRISYAVFCLKKNIIKHN